MSEILLACPFCGGTATMEQTESNRWSVGCDSADEPECMGYQSLTTFARRSEATKAWNTRNYIYPALRSHDAIRPDLDTIDAIISDNVYVDNDGVAGISSAAEAILAAFPSSPVGYVNRTEGGK